MTVSINPSPHVMVTTNAGQTWQRTVMPGAICSSRRLMSLKKTDETCKKTREAREKLELPQAPLRTLFSPVDTAHSPVIPA